MSSNNYLAKGLKRSALTVALGLCFAGGVQAQSTTGSIYGNTTEGATVTAQNQSGLSRTATADASGRYNIGTLPVGTYTVTVENAGKVISTRTVTVRAGSGADAGTATLDTVTVTASSAGPQIDITAVDTRSVITAEQIQRLPLGRSAESIALLAPGAVSGAAGFFGGLVSFGGSGVSENAYYVNGYFTGEPLSNLGGFSLPFGSIEQQETFIGGYSAKYGRSDGGVINQIGKRGTNEWKFGAQVTYTPKSLYGHDQDLYLPKLDFAAANANPNLPRTCGASGTDLCQYVYSEPGKAGALYSRGNEDESSRRTYSIYAGGPIIKDRLFFFASGEWSKADSTFAPNVLSSAKRLTDSTTKTPKIYAKVDWNITDNHFLEATYLREKTDRDGRYYDYTFTGPSDFGSATRGALQTSIPDPFRQKNEYFIGKYTGYLTDNLTLSATYGYARLSKQQINPSIIPGLAFLSNTTRQNPALNGGVPKTNTQGGFTAIDAQDKTHGLRAELEWVLGNHTLSAGLDNITFDASNEGSDQIVDRWVYGKTLSNISPGHVGNPSSAPGNPGGYYAYKLLFKTATSMSLEQKAYYLEDRWQVTDNLLLSLGVRNDSFNNKNNFGVSYLDNKNQWAPRLGFAWDVNGDSSLKVFGNAGRYFLALPNNVAIRGASASTFTRDYFTYSSIDANGVPQGRTPVPRLDGGTGPYSSNGEYGTAVDPLAFAPSDLKSIYQDEYILGMEKMLTPSWMLGVKLTSRILKSSVDDVCDPYTLLAAKGLTVINQVNGKFIAKGATGGPVEVAYCYMFNPGGKNTFSFANVDINDNPTGGRTEFTMDSTTDWGFPDKLKRNYNGLDVYLEHPFDGKWEARFDYTFSKSAGNNEGQVKSEFGQSNISKTQDWDAAAIMRYAAGYLANDRRHQLKMRGSYMITDELMLGANIRVISGAPISCLGFFSTGKKGEDEGASSGDPIGYGASYHTCFGGVASPGAVRNPWTKTIDLGLTYRPNFLDKKFALGVQVRNVLNDNKTLQSQVTSEDAPYTVSNTYLLPQGRQTPRTVQFTASYDW